MFLWSPQLLSETFLFLRRSEQDRIKNVHLITRYSYPILMKLDFFDRFSKNIIFHENPSNGSRVVPCGQTDTDGQIDMKMLIVAFLNFARSA